MSIFRVYFYDAETGKELPELSGKQWIGTSGNIKRNGQFVRGTCTHVEICDFGNMHPVKGHRFVTAKDFARKVKVKVWFGPQEPADWRTLEPDDAA